MFILTILFLSLQTNAQIRLLDQEDIVNKTPEELALMRNEIFARNGYTFSNAQYQNYFERFYRALYDNSKVKLSEIETENVNLLKERVVFAWQTKESHRRFEADKKGAE